MTYTQDQIDAVHELPLRKDVRWIDLSWLFPEKPVIIEETKRPFNDVYPGDPATGKFGAIEMCDAECAAAVVACHNEWLEQQQKQSADVADERG